MKRKTPRPSQACPICGRKVLVSCVAAHVGSVPCLVAFVRRGRRHADPKWGPVAERCAQELDACLREARGERALSGADPR
jgi:hypothetical protein